jgi:hypothetical protein
MAIFSRGLVRGGDGFVDLAELIINTRQIK